MPVEKRGLGRPGAGERRLGHPRTEEERRIRHKELTGETKLPPRGTGLRKRK